ncbi:hypothetical protein [Aeromonas dhakensis]|uniref:hypothetical protein n=1 Tax=Aeromonas dhakensis TaxID=196024 RepID=UPI0012E04DC1|nr:hypothetical protein [Aeromonas dhakensis]HDZ8856817.1 hypothetical protein [Aeromonas dhakensis]HDZ8857926.1 hypothetical protein [Aeromonas dhakensis]
MRNNNGSQWLPFFLLIYLAGSPRPARFKEIQRAVVDLGLHTHDPQHGAGQQVVVPLNLSSPFTPPGKA